ncbi:MAG TPA: hypothetical protein PLD84_12760, partial [Chitinophagales bacterium]|nr:hypothetical protein [Chitinophagales bacterium]
SGRHGIIVGLVDLAPTVWSYNPYIDIQAYGGIVGDGKKNSIEIYRILQKVDNYAVLECKQYRGGGYKDWVLPSTIELGYAFTAGQYGVQFNSDTAYWTSTAASAREAQVSAYPGAIGSHFKEWIRLVRPIRYF